MQRIALLLLLVAFAGAFAVGCHRRRPRDGTCAAHIDCNPGYDCVGRRCARRAGAPGLTPEAPVREPSPAEVPETPPPPGEVPSGEVPETPPPPRERPRRAPEPSAPIDNTPTAPPPDLPAWKARLKNS